MTRARLLLISLLTFAVAHRAQSEDITPLPLPDEIIYLSSNRDYVAVFSKDRARYGPMDLAISNPDWPTSPATYVKTGDGVQCLSVGPEGYSIEYAIKRPVRKDDTYNCLKTRFLVTRCFDECRAAIIEIDRRLSGNRRGILKASMYIDNCRGVIILGAVSDLSKGIPLNAEWLHGEVGILADPAYPNCESF